MIFLPFLCTHFNLYLLKLTFFTLICLFLLIHIMLCMVSEHLLVIQQLQRQHDQFPGHKVRSYHRYKILGLYEWMREIKVLIEDINATHPSRSATKHFRIYSFYLSLQCRKLLTRVLEYSISISHPPLHLKKTIRIKVMSANCEFVQLWTIFHFVYPYAL